MEKALTENNFEETRKRLEGSEDKTPLNKEGVEDALHQAEESVKYFEYDEALRHLDRISDTLDSITDDPGFYNEYKPKALGIQGHIYLITGKWTNALRTFKHIVDMKDNMDQKSITISAFMGKSEILSNRGKYMTALDNLKEGLQLAEKSGNMVDVAKVSCSMGALYSRMGEWSTGKRLLEKARKIAEENQGKEGIDFILASDNNQIGLEYFRNKELDKALEQFQKTIEMMESYPYSFERAEALRYIGITKSMQGDFRSALEHHSEALWIYQYAGYKFGQAKIYNSIGQTCLSISKLNEAIHFMEKAEAICRDMEADAEAATIYGKLGKVYMMKEEYDKAERFFTRDIEMCKKFNNFRAMAFATGNLGECSIYLGKNKQAVEYLNQSLDLFQKKGDTVNEQRMMIMEAKAFINNGELEKAEEITGRLNDKIDKRGKSMDAGALCMMQGIIERHKKNWADSSSFFNESLEIFKNWGKSLQLTEAYYEYGLLGLGIKDREGALNKFKEAFIIARDLGLQKQRQRYFRIIERLDEREIVKLLIEELE